MGATASTPCRRSRGFSLVELTVVIAVVALLVGSVLVPLATQVEQRQISDTERTLEEIKDAIMGFAATNGYLPCPDRTSGSGANDGQEDVSGGACLSTLGNVPWATLGVTDRDVWGNRFRYRVAAAFAQRSPLATFGFTSTSDIQVCADSACGTALTLASPNGAVAIILSLGKNGWGAINANTGTANTAPTSADELQNVSGSRYVSRIRTELGSTAGEFDDISVWISRHTLMNRMIAIGKLP